ncbi:taurine ABC transporter substrate-binding protein [Ensifer adhaerens]|uniref:taurine ABC transporter substrate-binding protein n=1 Tax=Ensifer adhaerens TaxID=106592 RepID=UPI001CBE9C8A|nr:taurine ABC transporter substrate-binding protein [Ensifer adhaerens]MBZ7926152.1 taurine ABC transporter substrate-binding protein [Ensifer adhaerens]UAX97476.1 taurine ABC transporter substrate-binding protein [Ensifer adhaerens]UAY03405.1 taurine ABC transporter substrate-binding protein [Ensifer adhaerens]UAY11389.1 taurine ABC transporter substrate-binding protein [Ensifer adhaerens]
MPYGHFKRFAAAASIVAGLAVSSAAYAETKLVVGYQQIVGPFVAAIADGRFDAAAKEVGYTIDWRQFSSAGDITTALASGDVPIGVLGSTGTASAATRGVDLQLFWILDNIGQSEALVAREGSGIETPADLKGKKVAVPFVSTSHFHLLVGMNKIWNIDPRKVEILNLKPPQIVAAWQRGDIDAAYVWPPALSEIQKTGKTISDSEVIGAASVPTFDGLVVSKGWAEENPKLMEAFTKVLTQAYADYNANKAAWTEDSAQVQGIVKLIGGDGPSTVEALRLLAFPNAEDQASDVWLGGGATRALSESAKFLVEQKQISQSLDDYAPFVNANFAKAAAQAQ